MYAYIYITDLEEGLVMSTAATLLDGNPSNNFLQRAAAFNPEGRLKGARNLAIAGTYAYILCDRGLVIVNIADPMKPVIAAEIAAPGINRGTAVAIQFRYAFVTDADGLKVVDVTVPEKARLIDQRHAEDCRCARRLRRAAPTPTSPPARNGLVDRRRRAARAAAGWIRCSTPRARSTTPTTSRWR